mmetsp:Transcript_17046/g.23644  ORF Transcript_17046/g.23644 Transcript_17046/m.23644 type:complete len:110 (-) Transcript_17046:83-412(-)
MSTALVRATSKSEAHEDGETHKGKVKPIHRSKIVRKSKTKKTRTKRQENKSFSEKEEENVSKTKETERMTRFDVSHTAKLPREQMVPKTLPRHSSKKIVPPQKELSSIP